MSSNTLTDFFWHQGTSLGPTSAQLTELVAASSRWQELVASTPTQRTEEDSEVACEALNQSVEVFEGTDPVWEFTMDPAPDEDGTYGIAGWTIEARFAKNIGDASLLTVAATIVTVGDASTPSVFRVSWSTSSIADFDGIYRFQVFRTDSGRRDLLAGSRLTAMPVITA